MLVYRKGCDKAMVVKWWVKKVNLDELRETRKLIASVDEESEVKRTFYINKTAGTIKKIINGAIIQTEAHVNVNKKYPIVMFFVHLPKLSEYKFEAFVHPIGGGDDYEIHGETFAEDEETARKQIRHHLIKKEHTHTTMANDFIVKKVS